MPEAPYADYFKILHNASEFVLYFGHNFPENEEAEQYIKIITNPISIKI